MDKVRVVPNGVSKSVRDGIGKEVYPRTSPVVCFVGNMGYAPNEEGALWFMEKIWPTVKAQMPSALFAAVGVSPGKKLKKYHDGQNVLVTGWSA